jgi:AraC-like DNA-binding protein
MSLVASELFKALFIAAIFATLCGVARLVFLPRPGRRMKLAIGAFLVFLLLPLTYLYLRLALPSAALGLLPFQALAIWIYGPALLVILHLALHQPIRAWQAACYVMPAATAVLLAVASQAGAMAQPAWWELVALAQALLFAAAAGAWTLRRRAQLRVLAGAFGASSFAALLYLSAGLLAMLATDFFVHAHAYLGRSLALNLFYACTAPTALYSLGISLALVWRATANIESASPESIDATPAPGGTAPRNARKLELGASAARELGLRLEELMRVERLYTRNDLSLDDLASALRLSTHQASELLNAHLDVSFHELLNRLRAEAAAELLRSGWGRCSLVDVAYQSGFNNPNTFHREFKRRHGVTPGQFRRALHAPAASAPPSAASCEPG